MEVVVKKYNLPDSRLLEQRVLVKPYNIWIPDKSYLVLGQSNNAKDSLYTDKVLTDSVLVTKRPSGGETVLLTRNMVVVSCIIDTEGWLSYSVMIYVIFFW